LSLNCVDSKLDKMYYDRYLVYNLTAIHFALDYPKLIRNK